MKYSKLTLAILLATSGMASFSVFATNGYFLPGNGFRSQGMGGVGIAYGRDTLSIATNPANIVNTGMRADIGFGIFNPERHAAVGRSAGQGSQLGWFNGSSESESKYFLVPEMGMTMPLTENLHAGFAVAANGGMNTTYRNNFFSFNNLIPPRDQQLGVDMMQVIVPVTVGYRVNENHSFGVALDLAETRFRAYGINAFTEFAISSDNDHMTNQGFDYSYGAGLKLGWLGEFYDDKLSLGLVYTSRTYMTKFDKYRGLFAEQGDFDIPENYGIGIAFKPKKNIVIAADILRINYNDVKSIGNRGPGEPYRTPGIPALVGSGDPLYYTKLLGLDEGMGFGWDNMTVYKLGIQYGVNERLQVRAGYNYGKSPIPQDQLTFNTLAPATVEKHYSVGFTYKATDMLEVTGTYMYVASNVQHAPRNQNILGGVQIDMHQNIWGISLAYILDPGKSEYGDGAMDPIDFTGWYAGLSSGVARSGDWSASYIDSKLSTLGFTSTSTIEQNSDLGFKVFAGYQVNKYLGIEGGFVYFNNMVASSEITAPTAQTLYTVAENNAWTLSAVGTLPVTKDLSVFGKLGVNMWNSNISSRGVGSAAGLIGKDTGTDLLYGAGVSYALLDNVDLRGEVERYKFGELDIDYYSGGLAFKF